MNSAPGRLANRVAILILAAGGFSLHGFSANAQEVQHLTAPHPGGMPGQPVMTGIERGNQGVTITWDGPSGYYQLFKKSAVQDAQWQPVGGPTRAGKATVPGVDAASGAIFQVTGPGAQYIGSVGCRECHGNIYSTVVSTPHTAAFNALKAVQQDKTRSCLPCHTVGYGQPTGFVNETTTPQLAGVQCENCHGPAANHAANENDPIARPRVDLAATVCGGCHKGPQSPNYNEWLTSEHAQVPKEVLTVMNSSTTNLSGCGRCHSGSVRLSLINKQPLPVGDANVAITCVVCHDPHQNTVNSAQLRNPIASTNNYYITTTGNFAAQYNPKINICGQCHNHRGAAWTTTSQPPHRSPQYNISLSTVGEVPAGHPPSPPASHMLLIEDQCVGCHMQTQASPVPFQIANTGHSFTVQSYELCRSCHPAPAALVEFTTSTISNRIEQISAYLDMWAATKAPAQLWAKYGVRAWEYTVPGDLSPPGPGPDASEQKLIPVNIQKARFNLYLVLYDGSYGVHNVRYSVTLLEAAQDWVAGELNR